MSDGSQVLTTHQAAQNVYEYRMDKLAHIFRDIKSDSLKGKHSGVYLIRDIEIPALIIEVVLRNLGFMVNDMDENYIAVSW